LDPLFLWACVRAWLRAAVNSMSGREATRRVSVHRMVSPGIRTAGRCVCVCVSGQPMRSPY
jgi:hypothetical protein